MDKDEEIKSTDWFSKTEPLIWTTADFERMSKPADNTQWKKCLETKRCQ